MTPQTIEAIRAHAVREFPREACGLLVVVRGREQYIACRNLAGNAGHFILSSEDYAEAENRGEIIAVVHSHPNGPATPSEADRTACEASGLIWHIVPVSCASGQPEAGEIVTLAPCGYEAPLVGREFSHGVNDCYQLVRDWYRRERGIELKNFMRIDGWWERGENLYLKHYAEAGFYLVDGEPEEGDMIVMQIRSTQPNHAAVYLGDGLILHHLYGRLSSRDVYGGYWKDVTRMIMRHRDMHCKADNRGRPERRPDAPALFTETEKEGYPVAAGENGLPDGRLF